MILWNSTQVISPITRYSVVLYLCIALFKTYLSIFITIQYHNDVIPPVVVLKDLSISPRFSPKELLYRDTLKFPRKINTLLDLPELERGPYLLSFLAFLFLRFTRRKRSLESLFCSRILQLRKKSVLGATLETRRVLIAKSVPGFILP